MVLPPSRFRFNRSKMPLIPRSFVAVKVALSQENVTMLEGSTALGAVPVPFGLHPDAAKTNIPAIKNNFISFSLDSSSAHFGGTSNFETHCPFYEKSVLWQAMAL